jgi:hypothetical protein
MPARRVAGAPVCVAVTALARTSAESGARGGAYAVPALRPPNVFLGTIAVRPEGAQQLAVGFREFNFDGSAHPADLQGWPSQRRNARSDANVRLYPRWLQDDGQLP